MSNNTNLYSYHGLNITLPSDVVFVHPWCLLAVTILLLALAIYMSIWSKIPEELYRCLAIQHIMVSYLHVTCLTFYNKNWILDLDILDTFFEETYSQLDLIITFTTASLSWIVFLRMFLFRNGEELYTLKEITIFSTLSIAVIEAYQQMMELIESPQIVIDGLRLTCVLLIMSVPFVVILLLLRSLFSSTSEVPKCQALFFMAYLLLFLLSDGFLLRFNLYKKNSFVLLWSVLLYVRLVVEIVFYVVFDRYLTSFFVY